MVKLNHLIYFKQKKGDDLLLEEKMASWLRAVSEGGSSSESSSADDKTAVVDNDHPSSSGGGNNNGGLFEYFGWVYHLGVNSIGHEYCHLRFMYIRGNYVKMYKRDPHENPGIKPIRRGTIGHTLMVEELGRRKVNNGDLYVLRFYNRLDETRKGEIACATAGEARKWMDAFDHAKNQAEHELSKGGSTISKLQMENEIDLEGRRPRVRRYAHGLKRLIRIGQGPEKLLHRSSSLGSSSQSYLYFHGDGGDAVETHEWKCVRTMNGVRILEDVASSERGKDVLVKAVGVVNASADTVFDVVLSLDKHRRYEWDTLTGDLELVDSLNGHYDVVYGVFDPPHLSGWQSKRDFVFSRQWFHGQDGTYTILQFPAVHKKCPPKPGYHRTKISPSTWEIRNLNSPSSSSSSSSSSCLNNVGSRRCIVTQTLEMHAKGWLRWKHNNSSKLEKTVPFALLTQVAGLKEYIEASPSFTFDSPTTVVQSKVSGFTAVSTTEFEDKDATDEFYDAISSDSMTDDDESDIETDVNKKKDGKVKLKNVAWAIAGLTTKKTSSVPDENQDLNMSVSPIDINLCHFAGSMRRGEDDADTNCWTSPNGSGFKIRGKTYLKDSTKVKGGEPLLKLIAVDWFKVENSVNNFALHPKCLVQSEAGKRIPFILVINLQIPAKPNYSLIMYYAADRPVNEDSLLGKFIDGSDMFRDSRFKLIPSIVEGYWMVKRAVGTKACLLGKAVPCKYLRQDNFLEIDIDIGSSSVARSVTGLVLGYVTSIVVDLALLVEAKEEDELPEYILGTVRLNRVRLDSAIDIVGA